MLIRMRRNVKRYDIQSRRTFLWRMDGLTWRDFKQMISVPCYFLMDLEKDWKKVKRQRRE